MSKPILLSPPHFSDEELKYVKQAFGQEWIAGRGENLDELEGALSNFLGIDHVVALNSGTAAIHLALVLLGIKRGDVVLCSTFTFAASANPIVYQGAEPVFIDSESETWNMDPELLVKAIDELIKIGKKPKAIIFVHVYGMPGKIEEVANICNHFQIPLIEDAAEALGATRKGKKVGTFGDLGVYSFNDNKIITTSGGGALVSNNGDWIERARFLASQSRDRTNYYQHSAIGYNYVMSNIAASIGRGQMEVLQDRIEKRREIFAYYKERLGQIEGVKFLEELPGVYCNRWLTTLLIDREITSVSAETLRFELEQVSIESRLLWNPMHRQPIYQEKQYFDNGISDHLFSSGLCLPSGSNMGAADLERVTDAVLKVLDQVTRS
ncbi:aminotransferase class I/II-fold pyridoxal phosphate-dependent enzyme [Fulvivirga sp. M361]|nr:aminotransferase class I/II-fold pyridoxal phosphate-dependent enzyme [Fulvivirga sp. M361]TRX50251.1 aminotransferase class I/II-fold pyridoxal phosphate-dependent enzyme [Fulvivirga sp. M361]